VLPSPLQAVDEALFDGGADMAVDAAHAGQPVAEPLGLGGFGNLRDFAATMNRRSYGH
jgi:hypothetical protein